MAGESLERRLAQDVLLIGRGDGVDLLLNRSSVSKRHALISRRGERYLLRDLESTNGTFVNSRRIRGEIAIGPRDRIYIGEFILRVLSIRLSDT